jgi:hypothetical protein
MDELVAKISLVVQEQYDVSSVMYETIMSHVEKIKMLDETQERLCKVANQFGMANGTLQQCHHIAAESKEHCKPLIQIGETKNRFHLSTGKINLGVLMANACHYQKKVQIKFVFKTDESFFMTFEYQGQDIEGLITALRFIYQGRTFSEQNGCVLINEMVDDYTDYMNKFYNLIQHEYMQNFKADIRICQYEFPDGVTACMVQPIDPHKSDKFMPIIFNITDNRTTVINFNNCTFNGGNGISVSAKEVCTKAGIKEKSIDLDYLKWISTNPPQHDERKSEYYKRMKNANPNFKGGARVHNLYMGALSWKTARAKTGHHLWAAK